MDTLLLLLALMTGAVLVVALGDRTRLPWPALMVLLGVVVAFVPFLPDRLRIEPDLILPLFLPPMLFATAQRTTWSETRRSWRSILGLSVGLVLATTAAVTGLALWLAPGMGVATAILLGAIVSPPDPVALEAVAGPLRVPRRLLSSLQTEGLFNDATAIVLFTLALQATATDSAVDPLHVAITFAVGAVVAVVIGLAFAYVARFLLRVVTTTAGAAAISLVLPFVVYVAAEHLHASGVVAVVVAAIQFCELAAMDTAHRRLSHREVWEVVEFLVTGVAFGLVGLEMRTVFTSASERLASVLTFAGAVCVVVVAVRVLWLLVACRLIVASGDRKGTPRTTREVVAMSWCGMRGLATLALALSLPVTLGGQTWFPYREEIIASAASVILVTLVAAGLTLPSVLMRLGISRTATEEARDEKRVRKIVHAAAVAEAQAVMETLPEQAREGVARWADKIGVAAGGDRGGELDREQLAALAKKRKVISAANTRILEASRQAVLEARRDPSIDPEAIDRVLARLDLRTILAD